VKEVLLSELAETDITEIWLFIAQDDLAAADRLIKRIYRRCGMLAAQPKAGRLRPELDRAVRSFVVGTYVIFYRESAAGIEVARVLHGRRDISSFFR
jgi:toxin ParE1/3/4